MWQEGFCIKWQVHVAQKYQQNILYAHIHTLHTHSESK